MKILVIGGGAREHALAWKLAGEASVREVICAPGNPGIAQVARCVPVDAGDCEALAELAAREQVAVTVVGPELPLSRGIVDLFTARGLAIVGPSRQAAELESSKAFAKGVMDRCHVPTARFRLCESAGDALDSVRRGELGFPVVIKADGLAAGKGVVIAADQAEAEAAIQAAMIDRRFGDAGDRVVLEEFMVGQEASYFILSDGEHALRLGSAQDHKRVFDDDRGPNTGGMGAFAPAPAVTPEVEQRVMDEVVGPVLKGMAAEGYPFRGFLYVGLMLTATGPRVVEFNARFGDPEAQVVFPRLDEDLSALLLQAAAGTLVSREARFKPGARVGVVLAAGGYPDAYATGTPIDGLEDASAVPGALVFHAGTASREGRVVTAGGRVLTAVGSGTTHREAIDHAYAVAAQIHFDGMHYRRDIGVAALQRA